MKTFFKNVFMLLIVLALCTNFLTACSTETKTEVNETKTLTETTSEVENNKARTISEETEAETEEETTEKETVFYISGYTSKGTCLGYKTEDEYQRLYDFTIKKGDTVYLNYISRDESSAGNRGEVLRLVYLELGMDTTDIINQFGNGTKLLVVTEEENYSFEYTGDKSYIFEYVGKDSDGFYWFDFHSVE
jgi:hypothetical protein